jgi:hypothetical protein
MNAIQQTEEISKDFKRTPWNSLSDPTPASFPTSKSRVVVVCRRGTLPGSLHYSAHYLLSVAYYESCLKEFDVPALPVVLTTYESKKHSYIDIAVSTFVLPKVSFIDVAVHRKEIAGRVRKLRRSICALRNIITGVAPVPYVS